MTLCVEVGEKLLAETQSLANVPLDLVGTVERRPLRALVARTPTLVHGELLLRAAPGGHTPLMKPHDARKRPELHPTQVELHVVPRARDIVRPVPVPDVRRRRTEIRLESQVGPVQARDIPTSEGKVLEYFSLFYAERSRGRGKFQTPPFSFWETDPLSLFLPKSDLVAVVSESAPSRKYQRPAYLFVIFRSTSPLIICRP